jgi:diaminopimelate epimerase
MRFWKMEGLGNDFVVVAGPFEVDGELARRLCDRRRGIGADGVLVVTPQGGDVVRMDYRNADGSPAEMCGNGLRCVARVAFLEGMVSAPSFTVETAVGPRRVEVGEEEVRVEIGPVVVGDELEMEGMRFLTASVGNPHAVTFVPSVGDAAVGRTGPRVEVDPSFPDRTNVEFVEVTAPDGIRLRVWERGVGETPACGSGAVAAAAVAHASGRIQATAVHVELLGGHALVEMIDGVGWLTGPARLVFSGAWPV